MDAKTDCRRFLSEKPCERLKECRDCRDYDPMGTRILIIKLGAGGDVLRTTSLLGGLKRRFPISHITWLTEKAHLPMMVNNPLIDRLFHASAESYLALTSQTFALLINLDKEPHALALAEQISADSKFGFGMDCYGSIRPLSQEAEYMVLLGISDQVKFYENTKTYPQMIYEACSLDYAQDLYRLYLSPVQEKQVTLNRQRFCRQGTRMIGLNTGSGPVFGTKKWSVERWIELADVLHRSWPVSLAILGGPHERERNNDILSQSRVPLVDTGTGNSLEEFISIVASLDVLVTADTLAMHIALALGKRVVVLIGPTSHTEIDLFGLGEMAITDFDCAPCYQRTCDRVPTCMEAMTAEDIAEKVGNQLALLGLEI